MKNTITLSIKEAYAISDYISRLQEVLSREVPDLFEPPTFEQASAVANMLVQLSDA